MTLSACKMTIICSWCIVYEESVTRSDKLQIWQSFQIRRLRRNRFRGEISRSRAGVSKDSGQTEETVELGG